MKRKTITIYYIKRNTVKRNIKYILQASINCNVA